jgi:hypothetical protein
LNVDVPPYISRYHDAGACKKYQHSGLSSKIDHPAVPGNSDAQSSAAGPSVSFRLQRFKLAIQCCQCWTGDKRKAKDMGCRKLGGFGRVGCRPGSWKDESKGSMFGLGLILCRGHAHFHVGWREPEEEEKEEE